MSLNEGFSETFILQINSEIIKIVLNFTKGMYTVYAPNGRILVRIEKLPRSKMNRIQKQIKGYMNSKLPSSNSKSYWGFRKV